MMARKELTFIGQLILHRTRIVIPKVLRLTVVGLAHKGHQGIEKNEGETRVESVVARV